MSNFHPVEIVGDSKMAQLDLHVMYHLPLFTFTNHCSSLSKFSRAAMLDQLVAMDTTRHLGDDDDFLPWYAADRGLTYLDIMLRYWSQYGDFRVS